MNHLCSVIINNYFKKLKMKFLKLILLSALISTIFLSFLEAQITETKVPPCAKELPEFGIISTEKGQIQFNVDDFKGFEKVELLIWPSDDEANYIHKCDSIGFLNKEPAFGVWTIEIWPVGNGLFRFKEDDSNKCHEYVFRLMAICGNDTLFSNCSVYQSTNESCSKRTTIETLKVNNFTYFPQPASEFLFVKNINHQHIESISIYNLTRQKLYAENFDNAKDYFKINLPKLNTGIYIIEIKTQNNLSHFKKISIH